MKNTIIFLILFIPPSWTYAQTGYEPSKPKKVVPPTAESVNAHILEMPINATAYSKGQEYFENKTDSLTDSIVRYVELTRLDIKRERINKLPENIGKLKNLKYLNLTSNQLTELPKSFEDLQNLDTLILFFNKFDSFPTEILKLKKLKMLDLTGNQIKLIPKDIAKLKNLETLYLGYNPITITNIEILGELKKLKKISINLSEFSSEEISILQKALPPNCIMR